MTFEWTLFDFGVRQAQTEIARSRSNEAEQVVEKVQRQATQEVVAAHDEVNANLARYKAASSLERSAAVAEDAVTKVVRKRLSTLTDTLSAQKARSLALAGKSRRFSKRSSPQRARVRFGAAWVRRRGSGLPQVMRAPSEGGYAR